MGIIAVPLDIEEGHTLPQFGLLRRLRDAGHRVCCVGVGETEGLVRDQGLEFLPIVVPEGSRRAEGVWQGSDLCLGPLLGGVLDGVMADLKPNVVIVRSQFYTEGLVIRYRYRLPIVFFISSFRRVTRAQACENIVSNALLNFREGVPEFLQLLTRSGVQFKNFRDVARLVLRFPELMMLPEAFDLPGRASEPGVYYIGAGVDMKRAEAPFDWTCLDPERPLVYCALGSQNHLQAETSRRFFRVIMDTAAARLDWQFIMAVGKKFDSREFTPAPENLIMNSWVPQLQVLARSDVMVNHAGFGTIKECVLTGVPMVVFPLLRARDHVNCAERVVYHGLGLRGEIEQVSPSGLESLIGQVIRDKGFKQRVELMKERFIQQDRLDIGVRVVEDAISAAREAAAF